MSLCDSEGAYLLADNAEEDDEDSDDVADSGSESDAELSTDGEEETAEDRPARGKVGKTVVILCTSVI